MYTHPAYARRGVDRVILSLCQQAAKKEGFERLELMGTLCTLSVKTDSPYVLG